MNMSAQEAREQNLMRGVILELNPMRVRPFADQPREYFDRDELISLELSIKQRGQLQPAMVRVLKGDRDHDYELVDGQRRWHACKKLGMALRAAVIDPTNAEDQFEISVAANFQRAAHTPMEIAKAIERMCTAGGRTPEYVATLFGKSSAWVYQHRRLNDLAPELQQLLQASRNDKDNLPTSVGVELARLPKDKQVTVLEEIKARGLSAVRAIDKIRRLITDAQPVAEPVKRPRPSHHDRNLQVYLRRTIQGIDHQFDRMGPDDFRLLVGSLVKARKFDEMKETVMTAIGRLEVLHRRLTECKAALNSEPAPPVSPVPSPRPLRAHSTAATTGPAFVYSHPMSCPKCHATKVRFKRRRDADPAKDSWTCSANGCQLRISHVMIRVERDYKPEGK